jgi:DHA2 family multidrug resistance protein
MKTNSPLLIISLFAIAAFGINSVMFTELSHEMAASSGLSTDEIELTKIGFMITQVLGFIFTPILARKLGIKTSLNASLIVGLASSLLLGYLKNHEALFIITWLVSGFFMSSLSVIINVYLIYTFEQRWLPALIALILIFSALLPMGAYPWLVAAIVEKFDWSLLYAVSAWLYFSALIMVIIFKPRPIKIEAKAKSNIFVYLLLAVTMSLIVFILMRGGYYNWFDSTWFSQLTMIAAIFSLLVIYLLIRSKSLNTASIALHSKLKTNVFMFNAFLAGFSVIASSILFSSFLKMAMHYNSLNAGYAQLPSFYAMLAGMLVSVLLYYFRRPLVDAAVPFGVLMILISVYKFSLLPSVVGTESLPLPMLLRGFGVGLLNVSVTISVFMYFQAGQHLEGLANFYLFRTMGGVIGGAFFSRVIQNHSAQASDEIGRTLDRTNHSFAAYEHALNNAILTHGRLPNTALSMSQISSAVKEQAATLALSNSLLVFIISIIALTPILLIAKKLAAKQEATL